MQKVLLIGLMFICSSAQVVFADTITVNCHSFGFLVKGILNQDEHHAVRGNIIISSDLLEEKNEVAMVGNIETLPAGSFYKDETRVLTLMGEKDSNKIVFRMINKSGSLLINGVPQMPIEKGIRKLLTCE